jgi:hypothetical protein
LDLLRGRKAGDVAKARAAHASRTTRADAADESMVASSVAALPHPADPSHRERDEGAETPEEDDTAGLPLFGGDGSPRVDGND